MGGDRGRLWASGGSGGLVVMVSSWDIMCSECELSLVSSGDCDVILMLAFSHLRHVVQTKQRVSRVLPSLQHVCFVRVMGGFL